MKNHVWSLYSLSNFIPNVWQDDKELEEKEEVRKKRKFDENISVPIVPDGPSPGQLTADKVWLVCWLTALLDDYSLLQKSANEYIVDHHIS